jgi:hypothetical protein
MKQIKKDDKPTTLSGTGDILGTAHLLDIALDTKSFEKWLTFHHGLNVTDNIFDGYMFGLRTLVRLLHQAIDFDFSLDLTEDFVLSRARFCGVPIAEVPNSCEKAILLRNSHKASRHLLGSSDFIAEWGISSYTQKRYVFATWERPQPIVFKKLKAIGVEIIVLSLENAGIGRKVRDRLKFVLNAEKSKPKPERDEFQAEN